MRATKKQSIIFEGRTLREGITNLFKQRHQFSRELRHLPTLLLVTLLLAIGLMIYIPEVQAPSICEVCPPAIIYPCDLPNTGATP